MANITFVDEQDNVIGYGTRAEAWEKGIIHRVSRVFLFNSKGELLLQQRSKNVDAPLLWDQSAAGHVDEGESYEEAAYRELQEELGVAGVPLTKKVHFFTEQTNVPIPRKRFNETYVGTYDGEVNYDEGEVAGVRWVSLPELDAWIAKTPGDFTGGFLIAYQHFKEVA